MINEGAPAPYALHIASAKGSDRDVKWVLDYYKIDIDNVSHEWSRDSKTALCRAASGGHVDVARLLIDRKANVNYVDIVAGSPLHNSIVGDDCYGGMNVV